MSEYLTTVRLILNGHPNAFARIVDNLCHDKGCRMPEQLTAWLLILNGRP
jgi:hypothetical protein